MKTFERTAALLALSMTTAGCRSVNYIAAQARGQLRVLRHRVPIASLLRRSSLNPEQRGQLRRVAMARRYALGVIGLRGSETYRYFFDTRGQPIAYNVSAAPKDALRPIRWSFPIVGRVPYLGFFRYGDALRTQRRLAKQGLDTLLRPVPAYSSLGWFADPLYSKLLSAAPARLIETVIHEMTHTTIFIRGHVAFNESLASFVGQQGTLNLLGQRFGRRHRRVQRFVDALKRQRRLGRLINRVRERLETLYKSQKSRAFKLKRREEIFGWAQVRYRQLFPKDQRPGSFGYRKLNNAVLLSYGRYGRGVPFHRAVYRAVGRSLSEFVALYRHAQHFSRPIRFIARRTGVSLALAR